MGHNFAVSSKEKQNKVLMQISKKELITDLIPLDKGFSEPPYCTPLPSRKRDCPEELRNGLLPTRRG